MIVAANWRLDIAKSPVTMLQEKTARTPHTLRVAGGSARYARSHATRTYIPQVGQLLSSFHMCVRKRKHSAAQQHRQNNENETGNFGKKKKSPFPLMKIFFCLIGAPCTGEKLKKIEQQSFSLSLVCRPPLSRPPRHRFGPGKAFLPLGHGEPRRPPRAKPSAHRGPRSPARQSWCSDSVALSLNFSVVAKKITA